jgi:hypothetical protein
MKIMVLSLARVTATAHKATYEPPKYLLSRIKAWNIDSWDVRD